VNSLENAISGCFPRPRLHSRGLCRARPSFNNGSTRAPPGTWDGWREPERRFDPRRLDTRLRSVVSLAYPYTVPVLPRIDWRAELRGRIPSYALGPDYHDTVLARTRAVPATLSALRPDAVTRIYVDAGPVLENV